MNTFLKKIKSSISVLQTHPICVGVYHIQTVNQTQSTGFNHINSTIKPQFLFMSKRNKPRINYKELHSTGKISYSTSSEEDLSQQLSNLSIKSTIMADEVIEIKLLIQEVEDTIDENQINGSSVNDVEATITKLEALRMDLRRKCLSTNLNENPNLTELTDKSFVWIKDYIKTAKDYRAKLNAAQVKLSVDKAKCKKRSMAFVADDVLQNILQMEEDFNQDLTKVDNACLRQLKLESESITSRLEHISQKYENLLQCPIKDADTLLQIKEIGEKYIAINDTKQNYIRSISDEFSSRELDKNKHFNKEKLNIKLEKFHGYSSSLDYYTFRSTFEKLYLQTTPSQFLPDLLKNNFLAEPASSLVKNIEEMDVIWNRLKQAYGNTKIMMSRKLQSLSKFDLARTRDPDKLVHSLSKFTNTLREVTTLAKQHKIEDNLYYGDSLCKIYQELGDSRLTRFLNSISEEQPDERQTWDMLIKFLEREEKLQEQKSIFSSHRNEKKETQNHPSGKDLKPSHRKSHLASQNGEINCHICGAVEGVDDHIATFGPGGTKVIQYFACKQFVDKTPAARLSLLKEKKFCFQCLIPGSDVTNRKHQEGKCQKDFICPNQAHQRYQRKLHVLLCDDHKDLPENHDVLERYKARCMKYSRIPDFAKQIKLVFHSDNFHSLHSPKDSVVDRGIYLLQSINANSNNVTMFYDNGCSDFILTKKAVQLLGPLAVKQDSCEVHLGGVGNTSIKSLGTYHVTLPMHNGKTVTLSGLCLDQITANFPIYPLTDVEREIQMHYKSNEGKMSLPKLPFSVGGEIHLMIGVKYLRYFPKLVYQLPTGLSLFESTFVGRNGERGIIGGPHKIFTEVQKHFFNTSPIKSIFFNDCYDSFRRESQNESDVSLLGFHNEVPLVDVSIEANLSQALKIFEKVESTGADITYRCPTCRACKTCKHHDEYESISIKEETEQNLINSSVSINTETHTTTASLPFIANPLQRLANNKDRALKTYHQQLKKLNKPENAQDKLDILDSEMKLQQLGFVEYLKNLPPENQTSLMNHQIQHYIPWRAVWKTNSVSTPCRIVYDASQSTSSGYSLNDLLAKGRNNLNRLQEIVIRWTMRRVAIHTDIKKMYNTIKLQEEDWCFQRYIWQKELDPREIPEEKIIKTLIYGVKSSGNQAEYGLRQVAELSRSQYPEVNRIVSEDIYVDDCITGEDEKDCALTRADELESVLNKGGFGLKGVSFSGEDPPSTLSDDGKTIFIAGMKWFPKDDVIVLNIGELNFARKQRGKKLLGATNIIPSKLTRRHCTSKVAEIFDLTGKVAPITASMKMDLQDLVRRKLDWDDTIPEDLRPLWESNFQVMQEIGDLRFNRAIVPEDAVNLQINTLDFGDASQFMVCTCVYARFKRRNGNHSCQLVLSRTKVVPQGMSQPRAELLAALTNSYTGKVVRRSFKNFHQSAIKFTDSQICLYWITNDQKPLKQWVRNRVIEIQRFTSQDQWFYIQSKDMIADLGTRRGVTLEEVNQHST